MRLICSGVKRQFAYCTAPAIAASLHALAELMMESMLQIAEVVPDVLRLQIHDSVVARLHKYQVANGAKEQISEIMGNVLPEWLLERTDPRIPILVDAERFD